MHGARRAEPVGADRVRARRARRVGETHGTSRAIAGVQLSRQHLLRAVARRTQSQAHDSEARGAARSLAAGADHRARGKSKVDRDRCAPAARSHRDHTRLHARSGTHGGSDGADRRRNARHHRMGFVSPARSRSERRSAARRIGARPARDAKRLGGEGLSLSEESVRGGRRCGLPGERSAQLHTRPHR